MATAIYLQSGGAIRSIVNVPRLNLLAFVSEDENIRVAPNYSTGCVQCRVFAVHHSPIVKHGVVRISEDVLCSMDESGIIYAVRAVARCRLRDSSKTLKKEGVLLKVNETRVIVADGTARITILSHNSGKDLEIRGGFKVLDATKQESVCHMAFRKSRFVVMGKKGTVKVWNYTTRKLLQQITPASNRADP